MKYLLIIAALISAKVSYTQTAQSTQATQTTPTAQPLQTAPATVAPQTTATTPAPPYYATSNNAITNNSVNFNSGTPMVSNPLENNNPSVQASIPITAKPSSLEVDMPQNSYPAAPRVINNNSQQNTTVKNKAVEGTQNIPGVVIATSAPADTVRTNVPATMVETSAPVVKSTVIYNTSTGVDASNTSKSVSVKLANGNTAPIRQTYISETVVTKFKNIYGENLYDIRLIRSGKSDTKYIIRILENGLYKTMYLNEDGVVIQ